MNIYQTTIKSEKTITGIGLHSGKNVTMKFKPAPSNTGIVFIRTDLNNFHIKASLENVIDTRLCTVIGKNKVYIKTIEHLMSALCALGIDNIFIELNECEVPIMDGSSAPFIKELKEAEITILPEKKHYLIIKKTISVKDGDTKATLYPSHNFIISFLLDYQHPLITNQFLELNLSKSSYVKEISRARTFGFLKEVEYLRSNNLALGGTLDNAVVLDDTGILNKDGLRYPDEFVRHKILDAIGDLYLLGYPIIGHFEGIKSGHDLNFQLCQKLMYETEAWQLIQFDEKILKKNNLETFLSKFIPQFRPNPQYQNI